MTTFQPSRRQLLAGGVAAALALVLDACSGSEASSTPASTSAAAPESTGAPAAPDTTSAPPATVDAVTTPETAAMSGSDATIAELAATNPDLTTALLASRFFENEGATTLAGGGPITVLATSNAGLVAGLHLMDTTGRLPISPEQGLALGNYHLLDGLHDAAALTKLAGTEVATKNGATVSVTASGSTLKVNDATVTSTDIMFANGVIHLLDTMLMPPEIPAGAAPAAGSTFTDVLSATPETSLFAALVKLFSLGDMLSTSNGFTVFAPTNDAVLAALLQLLSDTSTPVDGGLLSNVLLYHVVSDGALSSNGLQSAGSLNTLAGPPLTVTVDGATTRVNGAAIVTPDIAASNGTIHVIDALLIPPAS